MHVRRGTWRDTEFKEYNFNALGLLPACGALHPLLKARALLHLLGSQLLLDAIDQHADT